MFQAQKSCGNKWTNIYKQLKGKTDNVVKNHFYLTHRRQLRKLLRNLKGNRGAEPEEVSIKYIRELLKENKITYDNLDDQNIKDLLAYLDNNEVVNPSVNVIDDSSKTPSPPKPTFKYSL